MEESKVRNKATPAVRQLAQDLGLDLKHVQFEGSGPEGRILAEDVTRWRAIGLDIEHVHFEGSGPEGRILAKDVTRWACKEQRALLRYISEVIHTIGKPTRLLANNGV